MRTIPQMPSDQQRENATLLEHGARTALASRMRRELTEEEWQRERARLVEFVTILRAWDRQPRTRTVELENVA